MTKTKTKSFALLAMLAILLAGCSMWTNFTTYFNRYYNAKEKFLEAEEAIKEAKQELFEFRSGKVVSKAKAPLESVIEGCSKILQYNQESSYVNDALFLIGKAFYYQQKYLKADRKFAELFAQGKTDLYLDSKLWLSKTKLQLRNFDIGLKLIDEVTDSAIISENEEIYIDALITKTAFYLFRGNYEGAIVSAQKLADVSSSDKLKAEVYFEIGKMNQEIGNSEEALNYFAKVNEYSPTFEVEVSSKLEVARLKSRLDKNEESLILLEEMKSESKYEKYYADIDLELGVVNLELGNYNESLDILTEVDTVYEKSPSGGLARYYKGVLYETGLGIIDSAITYYKAAVSSLAPREFQDLARDRAKLLKNYVDLKKDIDGYYTKYAYLEDSTLYVQDSLAYEKMWREDSLKMVDRIELKSFTHERIKERALSAVNGILEKKYGDIKPEKNTFTAEELNIRLSKVQYEMGVYFYNDMMEYDSAAYYFDQVLEYYPDSIKTPQLVYTLASFYSTIRDTVLSDSLFNYVYENYKTELIANEAAKRIGQPLYEFETDPAKDIFLTAEKKYDSGNYNEALSEFKDIYTNYKESPYAPKALLASSYIYKEEIKNVDSTLAVYDSLAKNYPGTDYVKAISSRQTKYRSFIRARQDSLNRIKQDSLNMQMTDSLSAIPSNDSLNVITNDSLKITQPDSLKTENKKKVLPPETKTKPQESVPDTSKQKRRREVER